MNTYDILSRLENVRGRGPAAWQALCPDVRPDAFLFVVMSGALTTDPRFSSKRKEINDMQRNHRTIEGTLSRQSRSSARRLEENRACRQAKSGASSGGHPVPPPIPACLFLERFPLEHREIVLIRFFSSCLDMFCSKKYESLRSPKGLVEYVRQGVCRTLAEYRSGDAEYQRQFSDIPGIFEAFRDNLDRYPEEAEAFARLALDNYIYLDVCRDTEGE